MSDNEIISKISYLIDEGYSIGLATKKVCGKSTKLVKSVMCSSSYCFLLNNYMKKIGKNMKYEFKNGVLRRVSFSKED